MEPPTASRRHRPRALLGMAHPNRRHRLATALRHDGWIVRVAEDGYELIGLLSGAILDDAASRPDVIIADATMRGCLGTSVLQGLRELRWETPFILITDFGQTAPEHVMALRPAEVFEKPIDVEEVRAAVARYNPAHRGITPADGAASSTQRLDVRAVRAEARAGGARQARRRN